MTKLRFGIVGAGSIAQAYAQAFDKSVCCELSAVTDTRPEAAAALAEMVGGKSCKDLESLADSGVDAVIVATPPATHADIACSLLERKIPVLCEKPLCTSTEDAERMIRTASKNETLFTMASKFRYCEDVIKAKSILESGVLGEVLQVENAFTAKVDMSRRWNSDASLSGGGVLIDNGTHSVDIIRYLLGSIDSVLAVDAGGTQSLSVDENVKLLVKTSAGVTASVDLTWGINKELPYFLSIYGSSGTLHVGWRESKYRSTSNPDWTIFGSGYDKVASFKGKIENFGNAIRKGEELLISPADAMASVQVIEAAYRSMSEKLWQPVVERSLAAA